MLTESTTKLDQKTADQLVQCRRIMRTVNAQILMLHDVRAQRKKKKAGKIYTQYNAMVQIIIELLVWMRDQGIRRRESEVAAVARFGRVDDAVVKCECL